MNNDHGDNFVPYNQDCYVILRDLNMKVRRQTFDKMEIPTQEWCRDFATISWDGGSRTGKTTWIAENAGPNDLVVCHKKHGQGLIHMLLDSDSKCEILKLVWEVDINYPLKRLTYDRILVDNARLFNQRQLYDALYLRSHTETLFVMLG